ncbi:MAG: DNA translocase FtsK 4TM domain-containing protein [Kiritimatiellia bacterium]
MQSPSDSSGPETNLRRRLIGMFMFPIALFPALALLSYNWRDIPELCLPPLRPTANLIGVTGDYFAWYGYQLVGLAAWFIPVACVLVGLLLIMGKSCRPGRRGIGIALFFVSSTCLLQLAGMTTPAVRDLLHTLNIEPNAGGALGHVIMTRFLSRFLSPFGAGVLTISGLVLSVLMTIGIRDMVNGLARLTAWAAERESADTAAEREAALALARAAKERARADRLAEKERIAEKRAAEKAERERAKEELRGRREAERAEKARLAAERAAQKEAERLALEAERRAADEARRQEEERLRLLHEEQVAAVRKQHEAEITFAHDDWVRPRRASAAGASRPVVAPVRSVTPRPESAAEPPAPADAPAAAENGEEAERPGPYVLPPAEEVLNPVPETTAEHGDVEAMERRIVETLRVFHVEASPAFRVVGPVVTQYALTPALGVKAERISSLSTNLQMALEAKSVRILAPIPGKNAVGIEVPNLKPASVCFREIIDGALWKGKTPWPADGQPKFHVPLLLGKDAAGNDLVVDLAKIPHLLVAGATGQGKSVCLNSIINGLLMCRTPEQLRFIMVDPKRVEFTSYNRLPHLLVPVINDTKKVVFGLRWATVEMDKRLKLFSRAGCRNIIDFNTRRKISQPDFFGGEEALSDPDMPRTLPYIVIVIDEVADIMQSAQKEVEPLISRLTALARATGIHLILATQRPDTKVITGTIKSNIPGRIAFKTSSAIDSRTILDAPGAEDLIGRGDMLFRTSEGLLLRAQGAYISDGEINRIIDFIGEHAAPHFDEAFTRRMDRIKEANPEDGLDEEDDVNGSPTAEPAANSRGAAGNGGDDSAGESLFKAALIVLRDTKRASTSHLQRRMKIGYNHAARLMEELEERGVIGPPRGAGPREILIDPETLLNEGAAEARPAAESASPPADPDGNDPTLPPPVDDAFGETL